MCGRGEDDAPRRDEARVKGMRVLEPRMLGALAAS